MTPAYRLSPAADARLDEIHAYTVATWGEAQADRYIRRLFEAFDAIARREIVWRRIPAEFGQAGWYARHASTSSTGGCFPTAPPASSASSISAGASWTGSGRMWGSRRI